MYGASATANSDTSFDSFCKDQELQIKIMVFESVGTSKLSSHQNYVWVFPGLRLRIPKVVMHFICSVRLGKSYT